MAEETASSASSTAAEVWASEQERIRRRREAQGIGDAAASPTLTTGLALSGGGIRSATFSLGLMRALAEARLLEGFDYLSTVSGGGYAGAFFGSLFARPRSSNPAAAARLAAAVAPTASAGAPAAAAGAAQDPAAAAAFAQAPYDTLRGPICRPDGTRNAGWSLWWLRSSGRYLAPTGAGDFVYAAALALRNLLAVHYVLGLSVVTVAALAIMADAALLGVPGMGLAGRLAEGPGGGFVILASAAMLLWLVPLGLAYFATEMPKPGSEQAARPDWWDSDTWRKAFVAGLASAALAALSSERVAGWIQASAAARAIGNVLGSFGFLYTGSLTVVAASGAIAAIVFGSLICLGSAARFVEAGRHMPAGSGDMHEKSPQGKMLATRVVLTKRLATALKVILVLLAIAALVHVSNWLTVSNRWPGYTLIAGGSGGVLIALVKQAAGLLSLRNAAGTRPSLLLRHVALVLGFVLFAALAVGWFAFAWGAAASLAGTTVKDLAGPIGPLLGLLALLIPLGLATGSSFQFINLSSIQNLYSSRLVRAYLGASNPARADGLDTRWIRISDTHPDDNLTLDRYYAPQNLGPLHVINVTLNETVSPVDPLVQRDRHGRPLAISPEHQCVDGAYSRRSDGAAAPLKPAVWRRAKRWLADFFGAAPKPDGGNLAPLTRRRDKDPETMALGSWIGISGAAFSTGIGRGTSIGKSLLLGLANVRLGHWWSAGALEDRSGRGMADRGLRFIAQRFRTQAYLVAELLGRFSGRYAPYWYLSDGGHFDNTGVYELLRRRVGLVVCADNGADPDYSWDDLANLMRLARIDFGCEFAELPLAEPAAAATLASATLEPDAAERGAFEDGRCLRLFWVTHAARGAPADDGTLLVIVKPRLLVDAPVDVRQYARSSQRFPQETTADQFFSEEQWESYRKLGETVGGHLARAIDPDGSGEAAHAVQRWLALREGARRMVAGPELTATVPVRGKLVL